MTGGQVLRGVFGRQRRRALLAAGCWASHQICEAMVPVAFGLVIDRAVRTADGTAMVWSVLGILALFTVLTMSWRTGEWFVSQATLLESHGLRLQLVRRVLGSAPRPSEPARQTGEQLSIATSDAQHTADVLAISAWLAAASVGLITSAVVLLRIDGVLALGILLGVPLLMLGLSALGPLIRRRTEAQQGALGLAAAMAADLLQGLRPLRGFGGVGEASRRYGVVSQTSLRAGVGAIRASATFAGITAFGAGLLLAAVAGAAGAYAMAGRISVGELITVVGLAAFLSDPVSSIGNCVRQLATARASAGRVASLLGTAEVAGSAADAQPGPGLELVEVSGPGLSELSLRVEPGELVGLVTTSVATAAGLGAVLAGHTEPTAGAVRLGGVPLAEVTTDRQRGQLLVEPHTVDLFGETVREALTTGDDADDATLRRGLAAAALPELGAGDPLDHRLDDHGLNLSGGQRQRLAMARALVGDRPVLVFRDPTTAVDAVTENVMAEGLRHWRTGDRSTLLITASPTLLARCDRVLFVTAAETVDGTHAQLLARSDYAEAVLR